MSFKLESLYKIIMYTLYILHMKVKGEKNFGR